METIEEPREGDADTTSKLREVHGGRNDEELALASPDSYREIHAIQEAKGEYPTTIERSDLKPRQIAVGGTEIVLQRHGRYERERGSYFAGSLTDPRAEREAATHYFEDLLAQLPEKERDTVDIVFVASDTQYFEGGRRSHETATIAQQAALAVLETHDIPAQHILNFTGRLHTSIHSNDRAASAIGPRTMPTLREPNFLNDSPEFVDFMLQKYGGVNLEFWKAFEEDRHREEREAMGAEGPDDIANRTGFTVNVFSRYARLYHHHNPGRRLVIWAGTHYDTISPFVKRDVFGVGKERQLLVDYGAGVTIDINPDGHATTTIGEHEYAVPLTVQKTRKHSSKPQPPEPS